MPLKQKVQLQYPIVHIYETGLCESEHQVSDHMVLWRSKRTKSRYFEADRTQLKNLVEVQDPRNNTSVTREPPKRYCHFAAPRR
jgi:hypothetical protein